MRPLMMALMLTMLPVFTWAATLNYKGSGRIDKLDFQTAKITINSKEYSMDPYSFKAVIDGHEIQLQFLKEGFMVKFYTNKSGYVGRVELMGSPQFKRQLMKH
ncbi:hypothetical protein [Kistimonas asteriae]|uniref:hypothetical protein n=1 Tax=Kistimonas asteriae TaxID=517724 RepID=UPI001BA52F7A|nr:hypothetical protein [Kistimonas asteriae]